MVQPHALLAQVGKFLQSQNYEGMVQHNRQVCDQQVPYYLFIKIL